MGSYCCWLPPGCAKINAVMLAPLIIYEGPFMRFQATRAMCRELGIAIMLFGSTKETPCAIDRHIPSLYPEKTGRGQMIVNYIAQEETLRILPAIGKLVNGH